MNHLEALRQRIEAAIEREDAAAYKAHLATAALLDAQRTHRDATLARMDAEREWIEAAKSNAAIKSAMEQKP